MSYDNFNHSFQNASSSVHTKNRCLGHIKVQDVMCLCEINKEFDQQDSYLRQA